MDLGFLTTHALTSVILVPLIGGIVLSCLPLSEEGAGSSFARGIGSIVALGTLLLSLLILERFEVANPALQLVEQHRWIPSFGVTYSVGVDGLSLWFIILTTFLALIAILSTVTLTKKVRAYIANILVMESAVLGSLLSMDVLLYYAFWELMLIPAYFLVGLWGGRNRISASLTFVLYTVFGSVLMFVALLFVVWRHYEQHGEMTFLLNTLSTTTFLSLGEERWLFLACSLAFFIKIPLFPFHSWLPKTYAEANPSTTALLSGVLSKVGLYSLIRFSYPLFPRAAEEFGPLVGALAVAGIVYGALIAWAQSDMKRVLAYSSISHLGFCVLGVVALSTISLSGSIFQALSHGISSVGLFLLVGALEERSGTRNIGELGGVASEAPKLAFFFFIFLLGAISLPLTSGFVGEFLILAGSFASMTVQTMVALLGVILSAVYMLSLYRRVFFGPQSKKRKPLSDLSSRELLYLIPMAVLVFYLGLFPSSVLGSIEPTVKKWVEEVQARRESRSTSEINEKTRNEDTASDADAMPI